MVTRNAYGSLGAITKDAAKLLNIKTIETEDQSYGSDLCFRICPKNMCDEFEDCSFGITFETKFINPSTKFSISIDTD